MPKKTSPKNLPSVKSTLRTILLLICIALLAIYARHEKNTPTANILEQPVDSSGATLDTNSGAIQEAEEAAIRAWEEKKAASDNFRKLFAETKTSIDSLKEQIKNLRARRIKLRKECAEDLRQANKYTQLPIALRCYKAEMNVNLDILRKEEGILKQLPIASEDLRIAALASTQELSDASEAIMNAIDSKVFASLHDMEETKQNLMHVYKKQKWLKENQVKADILLQWSASIAVRTATLMEKYKKTNPDIQAKLFEGLTCLAEGDTVLDAIQELETYIDAIHALQEYRIFFSHCSSLLSEADALYKNIYEEEATKEEEEKKEEPYINRRLRRHLQ